MIARLALLLALVSAGCTREQARSIASEYPPEVSALAVGGGKGLPFFVGKDLRPAWEPDSARGLREFKLIDQSARAFSSSDLTGKIAVVSFFYSHCPGICPMTTQNLKVVQEHFKGDPRVVLLSFSVSPDSDTPAKLSSFAKRHGIDSRRWKLVTGDRKQIYQLAREDFGADTFSEREDAAQKLRPEDFLHSENVYLLDSQRRLRGVYQGRLVSSLQELNRDAGTLLR